MEDGIRTWPENRLTETGRVKSEEKEEVKRDGTKKMQCKAIVTSVPFIIW